MREYKAPGMVWSVARRAVVRALLLGPALATAGVLFGLVCGGALCLADGLPWSYAAWWGFRGACGGLAAGAIMGVISGIYHVEEPARTVPAAPEKVVSVNGAAAPPRPAAMAERNGVGRS